MKTIALSAFILLIATSFIPKPEPKAVMPVCHGSEVWAEMATQAADPAFARLHHNPQPFHFVSRAGGKMVTFKTADGKTANGYEIKADKASKKWLFVYQEWWGLNSYIKQEAEKYYSTLKDVNVLAVDMYDGKVATEQADAMKYMQEASGNFARLQAIISGAVQYAGRDAGIASVGWCFGGGISLQSALLAGKQAVGCVIYYGRPEKDVEKLKTLNTDVLGIFGSQDQGIPPASVQEFEENMKKADKKITVKMYDAVHAFANPSNPKYNKAFADEAFVLSSNYLKERFK
jgi:carboxymethylenebutenolidase